MCLRCMQLAMPMWNAYAPENFAGANAAQVTVRDVGSGAVQDFPSGQWLGVSPGSQDRGPLGTQALHLLPAGLGAFTFLAK